MKSLRMHYLLTDFISGIILICLPIYFKVFLEFSGFEVGIIYLAGGIVAVISAIVNSIIAQKIKNKKRVFNIGLLILILGVLYFNILLLVNNNISFIQAIIGSTLIFSMRSLIYILADEITTTYASQNEKADYGKIRSFGSLGWGANFLISGMILIYLPSLFMPMFLILALTIWINSFLLPNNKFSSERKFKIKDIKEVLTLKNYLIFLVMNTLMWIVLNNMNVFIEYTIVDLKGNLVVYYILSIVFIVFDMLTIHFSTNILQRIKSKKYIFLYYMLLIIKLGLLILYPTEPIVYLVAILDPFMFGLLIPYNSVFVNSEVPGHLTTIIFMISASMSLIFASIFSPIFGIIYDIYGSSATFLLMFIIVSISGLVALKLDVSKI